MGFYYHHYVFPGWEPCDEKRVDVAFCGLCEIRTGEPAKKGTVTTYLRNNPGEIRGSPSGDFGWFESEPTEEIWKERRGR